MLINVTFRVLTGLSNGGIFLIEALLSQVILTYDKQSATHLCGRLASKMKQVNTILILVQDEFPI